MNAELIEGALHKVVEEAIEYRDPYTALAVVEDIAKAFGIDPSFADIDPYERELAPLPGRDY